MTTSSTVILVRHGAVSRVSDQGVQLLYGPSESLNATGVWQMQSLGKTLSKETSPSVIYTSPTIRARESAQLLQSELPSHPQIIESQDLRAAHSPQWEDRPIQELIRAGGDIFAPNPDTPEKQGDTLPETYTRSTNAFNEIRSNHKADTVMVVTHSEIIGMIQHHLRVGEHGLPGIDATIDKGESLLLRWNSEGKLIESRVISPEGQPSHREKER